MDSLINLPLSEMRNRMAQRKLNSVELVRTYLERIASYEKQGSSLNAIRCLNPNILMEAYAYDREECYDGKVRGPLHGIPVLIKDNIDVRGMPTTAGSTALRDNFPKEDAPLVSSLKRAGALILGKANLTQWANFMTQNMPNGYSAIGGQVLNPYGPGKFDVGGSSSGSGSAVGAGLAPVAIGTETSGSILSPSSANSVYGLKPTLGLISRRGIIPIAPSQDTAGPMTRSVTDLALMMSVLVDEDPYDKATLGLGSVDTDYLAALDKNSLKGIKLGLVKQMVERQTEDRQELFMMAIRELQELGAEVIEVELPGLEEMKTWRSNVLQYEFKPALNAYLSNVAPYLPVHSLNELLAFNSEHASVELKYGQTVISESALLSSSLTESQYIEHRLKDLVASREQGIDYGLEHFQTDALVFPGPSAAGIGAKAGYPTLNAPIGYLANGQPYSLTFAGTAFSEKKLLAYAYAYEQAFPKRKWPSLQEAIQIN